MVAWSELWPAGLGLAPYAGMGTIILLGACLQGVGGMGFNMFCAPLAALFFPDMVPAPLLLLGVPLAVLSILREPAQLDWGMSGMASVGRALGALAAAAVLAVLPARGFALLFGGLILAGVGLSLAGWRIEPTPSRNLLAGVVSGLMGTITSAGAPPFAVLWQHMEPARVRATMGVVFFTGSTFSLIALYSVGRLAWREGVLAVALLPWMFAGFAASVPLSRRIPVRAARPLLLTLATAGATGVLVKALWGG